MLNAPTQNYEKLYNQFDLEIDNPKDANAIKSIYELISTEQTYLAQLSWFTPQNNKLIIEKFKSLSKEQKENLTIADLKSMLQNLSKLKELSSEMLIALEVGEYAKAAKLLEDNASLYIEYNNNYKNLPKALNSQITIPNNLRLNAYVITPVQRLPRYIMLSSAIASLTQASDKQDEIAIMMDAATNVANAANNYMANKVVKEAVEDINNRNWNVLWMAPNTKSNIYFKMILEEVNSKLVNNERATLSSAFCAVFKRVLAALKAKRKLYPNDFMQEEKETEKAMETIANILVAYDKNCEINKLKRECKITSEKQRERMAVFVKQKNAQVNPEIINAFKAQKNKPKTNLRPLPLIPGTAPASPRLNNSRA